MKNESTRQVQRIHFVYLIQPGLKLASYKTHSHPNLYGLLKQSRGCKILKELW